MAIAKILQKSMSFSAVDYNEDRVKKGEAVLLAKENFGDADVYLQTATDYKDYLQVWSERNTSIKYPQFHATISIKGKDISEEVLIQMGKEWMNRMGYGDNPFLIYLHNNTDNAHLHIVSSRIDRLGNKINDSFEKKRSLHIIDEISRINRNEELRLIVADSLRYSFSGKNQFYLLLERAGCKVKESEDKSSVTVTRAEASVTVSSDLIRFCMERYRKHIEKKELRKKEAILRKYSLAMNKDDFISFMKAKFGYDIFFFGDKDNPYGYALVDHRTKTVIQGKEIMPVKQLVANLNTSSDRTEFYNTLIRGYLEDNPSLTRNEINKMLIKTGGILYKDEIRNRKRRSVKICGLEKDLTDKIKVNDRKRRVINKYKPCSVEELMWIRMKTGLVITPDEIKGVKKDRDEILYYSEFIRRIMNSENPKEEFARNGFSISTIGNELLFVNYLGEHETCMFMGRDVGITRDELYSSLNGNANGYNGNPDDDSEETREGESVSDILSSIIDIFPDSGGGTEDDDPTRKKKKKKGLGY